MKVFQRVHHQAGLPRRPTPRRSFGVLGAVLIVLGAFGLTACKPAPEQIALQLTLADTASSNAPAANVTVSVYPAADTNATATANGITDENGNVWFTHDQLPAGDYQVMFGSPEFVINGTPVPGSDNARWYNSTATDAATSRTSAATVSVNDTTPTDATESYAVPRGHIDDRVSYGSNWPLPGLSVTAYAWPSGEAVATTTTSTSGLYHFGELPAQNYKLGFTKSGFATFYAGYAGSPDASETAYALSDARQIPATLDAYGDPNYTHFMQYESTITGTLTDGTNPIAGAVVVVFVAATGSPAGHATTATDGTFTLAGLSGTGYRLAVLAPNGAYPGYVYEAGTYSSLADGAVVTPATGANASIGTVDLAVGADCAAAQGGATNLANTDLHNCDLSLMTLSMDPGVDFSGANLSGANFSGQMLFSSDLSGANLTYTDLSSVDLGYADISDVDLSTVDLTRIKGKDLSYDATTKLPEGWKLVGPTGSGVLVGPSAWLYDADLSGADLSGMTFSEARWVRVDLSGTNLTGATLAGIDSSGLISNANTILPTGWEIVGGVLQQS